MAFSSTKTDAANDTDTTADKSSFQDVADNWNLLSSGDTITGELLNFLGALGKLAKNLSDVLSVVNKYI